MNLKGCVIHLVQYDGKDRKYLVIERVPLILPSH